MTGKNGDDSQPVNRVIQACGTHCHECYLWIQSVPAQPRRITCEKMFSKNKKFTCCSAHHSFRTHHPASGIQERSAADTTSGGEQSKEATTPDARIRAGGRNVCITHRLEARYQERGTTCATCDELPDAHGSPRPFVLLLAAAVRLHASVAHWGNKHPSSTSDRRSHHKSHSVHMWEQEGNHKTLSCRLLGETRNVSRCG